MISTLPPSGSQEGPLVKDEEDNYQDDLLQESLLIEGPNMDSQQHPCKGQNSLLQDSLLIEGPNIDSRQQPCKGSLVRAEGDSSLQDSLLIEDPKFDSQQQSCKGSDKFSSLPEESQLCNRDLLSSLPFIKNGHQKTQRDKQAFPVKSKSCAF